jgi:hypothetical protein
MRKTLIIAAVLLIAVVLLNGACASKKIPTPTLATAPSKTTTSLPMPPSAPSNVTAEAVSPSQVRLRWLDNSNNEQGFTLYRDNKVIANLPANTSVYEDADLKPAATYYYMIKAYNETGESGTSSCSIRTPNPPIAVRLDKIGVYDNREDWARGEDGEVYVGIIVTDGKTIVEKQSPEGEGQHYKLKKNETVDIGTTIFSVDEVGEYIRIAAVGYEDDGGQGEMLLYQALGAVGEAYISGGASTLLEMTDISLGNLLAKIFGAEDDWLGSYENAWGSGDNWGIGQYQNIVLKDERGVDCLRLWFTIESPMDNIHIGQTKQVPTPVPIAEPFFEVLQSPNEARIGDYITIVARTNYHLIDEDSNGLYGVEGILGTEPHTDTIISDLGPGGIAQADSNGIVTWHIRVPQNAEEDGFLLEKSDLVPGVLRLKFTVITHYDGNSAGGYNTHVTRTLVFNK